MLDTTGLTILKLPLLILGTIISLGTVGLSPSFASEDRTRLRPTEPPSAPVKGNIPNGVYLYGQSPEPDQIGKEYLIFNVDGNQVVGAAYLPRSEFSCFFGTVNSQQMALSMVDPYDQTIHPYNIALQETSPVATASGQVPRTVGLVGYQRLEEISDNDRRMLNICLDYQSPER